MVCTGEGMGAEKQKKPAPKMWGARISEEAAAVLHVVMAFEECSAQELVAPVLEEYAEKMRAHPEIRRALAAKEEYGLRQRGKLAHIDAEATSEG
ncbi:MAG TPA: hypothetical protein VMP41_16470 [Acidimicrobiales bacterium]|nr:hypothetical protein [Acidimicrobiales bacterium]